MKKLLLTLIAFSLFGCVKKETCNCTDVSTGNKKTFTGTPSEVSNYINKLYITNNNTFTFDAEGRVIKSKWYCTKE